MWSQAVWASAPAQEDATPSVLAHVPTRAGFESGKNTATVSINDAIHAFVPTLYPVHFPKAFAVACKMNAVRKKLANRGKTVKVILGH